MKTNLTNSVHMGQKTFGFTITDDGGRLAWSASGFVHETSLNDAIAVARRAVAGLPPRAANLKMISVSSAAFLSAYVADCWPGLRVAAE